MRILLHVGMPKAGSTAIQQSLAAARDGLLQRRILFPAAPLFGDGQNFLVAGLEDRKHLVPRMIRNAYEGRERERVADFERWFAGLKSDAVSGRIDTLVLSSEWLFGLRGEEAFSRLARLLGELGGSVEIVAYVRRPSDQYLSAVQQTLKGTHAIRAIGQIRYRAPLQAFAGLGGVLHVAPYDRETFPDGDIVRHFVASYLPAALPVIADGPRPAANSSMSAEAMAILADYRRANHRARRGRFTADTNRLISALRAADMAVGGAARPRLLDTVRAQVDQASVDLLYLRDVHGVTFPEIDYARIARAAPREPGTPKRPQSIAEICVVEPARRAALEAHVGPALTQGGAGLSGWWRRFSRWSGGRGAPARR